MEEMFPNSLYNFTANFNALADGSYITKYKIGCGFYAQFYRVAEIQGVKVGIFFTQNIFCISVAIVISALAGPQWLFTEEKLPNSLYNGTANFNALDDGAYITKYTKSSLWILCTTIQDTVTKSCPFFLASGIALLISFLVYLIPTCSHQNSLYYFTAGIMFIVSGLLMLIGLIAYISILKAEIGSKLRARSTLQPPLFKVNYGQSFFLFVFGFVATEFIGLLSSLF